MTIELTIPAHNLIVQQKPELRLAETATWLEEMCELDDFQAAQHVSIALSSLNRWEVDDALRFKLLTLYQPVVRRLIFALLDSLPDSGPPQRPVHRNNAHLAQELGAELSLAWKLVHRDFEKRFFKLPIAKDKENILASLLRSIALQINISYRTYCDPPENCWLELHQVFQYLHGTNTPKDLTRFDPASVLGLSVNTYKRCLLLSLVNPFRCNKVEMIAMQDFMRRYASLVRLQHAKDADRHGFLVNANVDIPCVLTDDPLIADGLIMDTHRLTKNMRRLALQIKAGKPQDNLGIPAGFSAGQTLALIEKLTDSWWTRRRRAFQRHIKKDGDISEAVYGIENIHRLISPVQADQAKKGTPQSSQWTIRNDSASGLSISTKIRGAPNVSLGAPMALRASPQSPWMLGMVRWVKIVNGQDIELGLEKLAPVLELATLHFEDKTTLQAFYIPGNKALNSQDRLLLPTGSYVKDREAELEKDGEQQKIVLSNLLDTSQVSDMVGFEPLT